MTRAGLGLAVIIAVYAALLFADLVGQAVNDFRRNAAQAHGLASPDNLKSAAARKTFGGIVQAGSGSLSHFNLLPVLSAGSEKRR